MQIYDWCINENFTLSKMICALSFIWWIQKWEKWVKLVKVWEPEIKSVGTM